MVAARLADVDDLNRRARHAAPATRATSATTEVVLAGRGFAEGDDVLALRNDYRLGLLNGTRAVIERIDTTRHELILATDTGERLVVPFAYAEAGHLTHGYATTIHKAQGATVDRCLVLARRHHDPGARLHRPVPRPARQRPLRRRRRPPSRGTPRRRGRTSTRSTPSASAIGRSASKRMALDDVEPPPVAPLEQLRRERDGLRARLGDGPPDPSWDYRRLSEELAREKHYREGAQWRLDTARKALHDLGPIGRRTHRAERRELERASPASRPTSPATTRSSPTSRRSSPSSLPRC